MSRDGTRDTQNVSKEKTGAFLKLFLSIEQKLGGKEKACDYVGITRGHYNSISDGAQLLSIKMAKKILDAHKRLKT
jgi:hypothetical protein